MRWTEKTPLKASKDLKGALILHRLRAGLATRSPSLDSASIDEVEDALGIWIPSEILTVFAANGRNPYQMVLLTEEAAERADLPHDLVAMAHDHSPDETSPRPGYWCFKTGAIDPEECTVVRWTLDPDGRLYGLSVLDFVRACLLDGPPTEEEAIAVRGLATKFRPMVQRGPYSRFRRVVHHRFGPGVVLREFNDGNHKLEVEFPTVGTKLLLATYVQDASRPEHPRRSRGGALRSRRGAP